MKLHTMFTEREPLFVNFMRHYWWSLCLLACTSLATLMYVYHALVENQHGLASYKSIRRSVRFLQRISTQHNFITHHCSPLRNSPTNSPTTNRLFSSICTFSRLRPLASSPSAPSPLLSLRTLTATRAPEAQLPTDVTCEPTWPSRRGRRP